MDNTAFSSALEQIARSSGKPNAVKIIGLLKTIAASIEDIKKSLNRIEKKIDSIIVGDLNNAYNILINLPQTEGFSAEEVRLQVIQANKDFSQAHARLENLSGFEKEKVVASFYCALTHFMIGNYQLSQKWVGLCEDHIVLYKKLTGTGPYRNQLEKSPNGSSAKAWATAGSIVVSIFFPVVGIPSAIASGYSFVKASDADSKIAREVHEISYDYSQKIIALKKAIDKKD